MSSEESSASLTATTTADNNSDHSDMTIAHLLTDQHCFVDRIMRGPINRLGTPGEFYEVKWKGYDQ